MGSGRRGLIKRAQVQKNWDLGYKAILGFQGSGLKI
jgi:hypothetical protein